MFDWMLPAQHAIAILKKDHDTVKTLFDEFEKAESPPAREKVIAQAILELKLHAEIEEEIFYPTVRAHVGGAIMNEADEEHHVARVLIAELDDNAVEPGHRAAKFTVLAENVRHHIREEENEMLPKAKELNIDFMALGQKMQARKAELMEKGIPADAEHGMVGKAGTKKVGTTARKRPGKTARRKTATAKAKPTKKTAAKHAGKTASHASH